MVAKKKKSVSKATANKQPKYRSFRLTKEKSNFVTFRVTKQTLYWIILLVYIFFLDVWVANAQMSAMVMLL